MINALFNGRISVFEVLGRLIAVAMCVFYSWLSGIVFFACIWIIDILINKYYVKQSNT